MARSAQDVYGDFGSVPQKPDEPVRVQGSGAGPMQVHANAEDFGGAIGAGLQKVGETAEDLAVKYGNMVNETQANNAEATLAQKIGNINANYKTKTGMAAYNAYPQYQADVEQAYKDNSQGLTLGAQQAYMLQSRRMVDMHLADNSGYAASQLNEAHRDSWSSVGDSHIQQILDPSVATNPKQTGYNIQTAVYAEQAKVNADHPGLKTDPDTGAVSFDESKPEGQQLKQQLQRNIDAVISQGKVNQYTTLAKPDVMGVLPAYDLYQKERDSLPPQAQVALDSSFAPKVFNAHKDNVVGTTMADAAQAHSEMLYNPKSDIATAIHQQESGGKPHDYQIQPDTFKQYAKPGESFDNPADQDAVYGRILGDLQKSYPNDPARQAVAYFSGKGNVAPAGSETPYIEDRQDKNGKSVSSYVADINGRLGTSTVAGPSQNAAYTTTEPKYGTNANGAPLTQADYFRTHSVDVLAKGDAYAEQTMPGDLAFKRAVRQTLQNSMEMTIRNETQQHAQDNRSLIQAINGSMTKGKPPETEAQLRAIPGVSDLLDKVSAQDPRFAEGIPTMIAKMSRQNVTTNSSNGYDTILRTLEPHGEDHPNAIASQDHLDRLLGRTDGTGINMKDYNDAKPLLEADQTFKDTLSTHMQQIASANGNLDGKGQERALTWYNQVMAAKKQNDTLGDKKLSDADFITKVGEKDGPPAPQPPSRMQQLENAVVSVAKKATDVPQVKSLGDYNAISKDQQYRDSDGNIRTKR